MKFGYAFKCSVFLVSFRFLSNCLDFDVEFPK